MKKQNDITNNLMVVCNPKHPHHGCTGYLTGEVISVAGAPMAKMRFDNCKHLTDGCYVQRGDIREV